LFRRHRAGIVFAAERPRIGSRADNRCRPDPIRGAGLSARCGTRPQLRRLDRRFVRAGTDTGAGFEKKPAPGLQRFAQGAGGGDPAGGSCAGGKRRRASWLCAIEGCLTLIRRALLSHGVLYALAPFEAHRRTDVRWAPPSKSSLKLGSAGNRFAGADRFQVSNCNCSSFLFYESLPSITSTS
jgi:hypothetical protein